MREVPVAPPARIRLERLEVGPQGAGALDAALQERSAGGVEQRVGVVGREREGRVGCRDVALDVAPEEFVGDEQVACGPVAGMLRE